MTLNDTSSPCWVNLATLFTDEKLVILSVMSDIYNLPSPCRDNKKNELVSKTNSFHIILYLVL